MTQDDSILGSQGTQRQAFKSAHPLAMLTVMLLMFSCVLTMAAIVSQFVRLIHDSDPTGPLRYTIIFVAQLALLAVTTAAFLFWVYRAYKNLAVIQLLAKPRLTPEAAIEGFFVPGLNLYRPYEVLRQLWAGGSHSGNEASWLVGAWWGAFVGSWVIGLVGWLLSTSGPLGGTQRIVWSIVSQVIWLAAAMLGVALVRGIDLMQKEKVQMVADLQSGPAVKVAQASRAAGGPS